MKYNSCRTNQNVRKTLNNIRYNLYTALLITTGNIPDSPDLSTLPDYLLAVPLAIVGGGLITLEVLIHKNGK